MRRRWDETRRYKITYHDGWLARWFVGRVSACSSQGFKSNLHFQTFKWGKCRNLLSQELSYVMVYAKANLRPFCIYYYIAFAKANFQLSLQRQISICLCKGKYPFAFAKAYIKLPLQRHISSCLCKGIFWFAHVLCYHRMRVQRQLWISLCTVSLHISKSHFLSIYREVTPSISHNRVSTDQDRRLLNNPMPRGHKKSRMDSLTAYSAPYIQDPAFVNTIEDPERKPEIMKIDESERDLSTSRFTQALFVHL